MKYRIKKETKPTLPTFGKYKAVAVHHQTIDSKQLVKETAQRMGTDSANVYGVLLSMAAVVNSHLRAGDKVRLPDWGMMKLEIESEKVDDPQTFRAKTASISFPRAKPAPRPSTTASLLRRRNSPLIRNQSAL